MLKILFVIPSLEYGDAARQLCLLATALPRDRSDVKVCVLGTAGPWADALREKQVDCRVLGWRRWTDPRPLLQFRAGVREERPDLIHACQLPALRTVLALGPGSPVVASSCLPRENHPQALSWLDGRLLGRVAALVAGGPGEVEALRRRGWPEQDLHVIAPGIGVRPADPKGVEQLRSGLGLTSGMRLIACVGSLERRKGFRDALWALDILRFLYDDLHLLLIGAGPDRSRLEELAHQHQITGRVHFLGRQRAVRDWLAAVEVVWSPGQGGTGRSVVLEAMAEGRPVIASRHPLIADLLLDGRTGFLIESGDQAALARQTRLLLDDADARRRIGEGGRQRAADHFSVATLVREYGRLYERIAFGRPMQG
jgi:glycosyltransferase involved in cell wall biosynthesis